MTVYLLDGNVLIALIDRQHANHDAATLATFDRRIVSDAVEESMHLVRLIR